jgi:hypothetical protein
MRTWAGRLRPSRSSWPYTGCWLVRLLYHPGCRTCLRGVPVGGTFEEVGEEDFEWLLRGRILSLCGCLGAPVFWVASLERDKARLSSRQERDHESVHLSGFVVLNPVGRISDMEHLAALTKGNARFRDS